MKSDLTTKILLGAIALGLLANAWRFPARPAYAIQSQGGGGQAGMKVTQTPNRASEYSYDDVHIISNGKYYHFSVKASGNEKPQISAGIPLR